jgi:hypothetical protein
MYERPQFGSVPGVYWFHLLNGYCDNAFLWLVGAVSGSMKVMIKFSTFSAFATWKQRKVNERCPPDLDLI